MLNKQRYDSICRLFLKFDPGGVVKNKVVPFFYQYCAPMERSDYRSNVISRNNNKPDQFKTLILFGMETEIVTGTIAINHKRFYRFWIIISQRPNECTYFYIRCQIRIQNPGNCNCTIVVPVQ